MKLTAPNKNTSHPSSPDCKRQMKQWKHFSSTANQTSSAGKKLL
jgi:hypothetical protein